MLDDKDKHDLSTHAHPVAPDVSVSSLTARLGGLLDTVRTVLDPAAAVAMVVWLPGEPNSCLCMGTHGAADALAVLHSTYEASGAVELDESEVCGAERWQ